MADKAYEIYVKMVAEIVTQWLTNGSDELRAFKENVKKYFKTPKRKSITEASEILEELRRMGKLNENNLDVLFELTDGINDDLKSVIEEYENQIKQANMRSREIKNEPETVLYRRRRTSRSSDSPVRKRERVSESDDRGEFRKGQDTSLKTKEMHQFVDKKTAYSVGYIEAPESGGTGFMVGNKYVMTAFHVMRATINKIWNATVGCSQESSSRIGNWNKLPKELRVELGQDHSPEDGIQKALEAWRMQSPHRLALSEVIGALHKVEFSDAADEIISYLHKEWKEKTSIQFGPNKDIKFHFKFDIPYLNPDLDIIVLEIDNTNSAQSTPKSLKLQRDRQQIKPEMHLIGYPRMQGYDQILDPKCIVICTDRSRSKAVTDINEAKAWFKGKFPNDRFPFDQEYNKIESLLTISEFVLFHSSESTAHCASGGPGIVEWDSDRPVVQAMLVSGCPPFTYSTNTDGSYYNGVKIPLEYLFEKGLLMARLHEQLSKDDEKLRNELFYM